MGSPIRSAVFGVPGWQALGVGAFILLGCTGQIVGDGGSSDGQGPGGLGPGSGGSSGSGTGLGPTPLDCKPADSAKVTVSARIRRLTRLEFENTLADLLGDATRPLAREIEADTFAIGYSTGDERGISSNYVDGLNSIAERAAANLQAAPESQAIAASCYASATSATACAKTFITTFGARVLRRPLVQAEIDGLLTVYTAGHATIIGGDENAALHAGLDYATRALLQSPNFVFRTELGDVGATGSSVKLTPFETAAALSYALTASPPDAELLTQAANSALATQEQLMTQGRRLLDAHPERFARQAERFVREWLTIDVSSPSWKKDATLYPDASPAFKAGLDKETELFLRDWARGGSLTELLTTSRSFVSSANASAYGMSVASADFTVMDLDPLQRAGILTQPAFLGSRSRADGSSPVQRGIAVMKKLLCLEPRPVPNMVPPLPPADHSAVKTTRDRYKQHTSVAFCAGCHSAFDPMGYAFEHYDAIGRYRDTENDVPIDSSGAIVGTANSDATVTDAIDLSKKLSASPEVHACFVRQTYRFTVGHQETDADACAIAGYAKQFDEQNLSLRDLILTVVTAPALLERIPLTPDP